jgi:hypothetical protein
MPLAEVEDRCGRRGPGGHLVRMTLSRGGRERAEQADESEQMDTAEHVLSPGSWKRGVDVKAEG